METNKTSEEPTPNPETDDKTDAPVAEAPKPAAPKPKPDPRSKLWKPEGNPLLISSSPHFAVWRYLFKRHRVC